ncbi:NAD-glutamate dehydrogenase domain-containing protein [Desulfovibrio sp. TomC]|uniref:NAD-glutamate dehydrogenase domain-containing protein n=1 Tax=Desulfovibrio sp. TomC TaxID=1562888 RepID=UPI0005733BB4|nr:NAD-glutamate dehydrogenase domain-containing protein [Desulfovibrio sp. TomC]KHK03999.1 Glu/Leu/Phe/Val dehydrogenase family protein [Desulfovibrio sp. TomC]
MTLPERPNAASFARVVNRELRSESDALVPWFLANMPAYYFRTHAPAEQARHIRAVISGEVLSGGQSATLWNHERTRVTRIAPAGTQALLEHLAERAGDNIRTSRLYASQDGRLRLDTFLLEPQEPVGSGSRAMRQAVRLMESGGHLDPRLRQDFIAFLRGAPADYVEKFDPLRAARHFALAKELEGEDGVRVELHLLAENTESRLVVAMREPPRSGLLLQVARTVLAEELDILRGYSDRFVLPDGDVSVISLYVAKDGLAIDAGHPAWKRLRVRLRRVKWTVPMVLDALTREYGLTPEETELTAAGCECVRQFLVGHNPHAFSSYNVNQAVLRHVPQIRACLVAFDARFNPALADRHRQTEAAEAAARADIAAVEDEVARRILLGLLALWRHTRRTNAYLPERFGLAFRLDPAVIEAISGQLPGDGEQLPHALFYLSGPHMRGFHVRYREMARGGVRLVRAKTSAQLEAEAGRLYAEAKNLALSQQFKNKDIPEGGAKAVLLLGPGADATLALKSAVDGLLDLLVLDEGGEKSLPGVVDHLGHPELVYLGPDEGITPDHIRWIVRRAVERGYGWPRTFMSSKPEGGINHKRYGVTSLGVLEFADAFLREAGINPDAATFTVKLTGGPAGDVAGNALLELFARYGDRARVVAVSDGHGAAYDPRGLDHAELARLVAAEHHIAGFSPDRLSGDGAFVVRSDTPGGAKIRSSLHNTAAADLFIPAGGRPDTINDGNWREFCDSAGRPSARVIIEGANLFLTGPARQHLEAAGALIAPGPSANKAGVICSSYEILAGMAMSEAEFAACKRRYVPEVLAILRQKCRAEAGLLLRERRLSGGRIGLVALSRDVSAEITALKDAIGQALAREAPTVADVIGDKLLRRLVAEHCPPLVAARFFDQLLATAPASYLHAVIAAHAASSIVYAEGLGWLSRLVGLRDLMSVVRTYFATADVLAGQLAAIAKSRLPGRLEIAHVLARTGHKTLCEEALALDGPRPGEV